MSYSSSSSSDSGSDSEEHRPVFGAPLQSQHASQPESTLEGSSNRFAMYNSVSQKLMAKMGFREGEGLGKFGQGRKEIIETSTQRGRRGLGLMLKGFQGELNVDWEDEPQPSAVEQVSWFPECSTEVPDAQGLREWMAVGKSVFDELEGEEMRRARTRSNPYETIRGAFFLNSEDLLHSVLRCKSVFDELEGEEMRRARTRSNPYETIRGAFFLNRAAMKMANIDHVFDNMFTNPKDLQGRPQARERDAELLYFADVCAGPGGFSEYVLWRRRWHAKGFGMTLKGPNDFKLEDFFAAPSELFEPYYGEGGVDGDGDITRPENISAFRNFVLESTEGKGVHFLMADGGFSVEGQENIQEILSKQLLLCQFLTGLSVIRTGGHFLCKTFDLFTPFSVGLIYLLHCCFERISLFKPVTSRPANSERYVVCRGLKPGIDAVRDYFFAVNLKLNHLKNTEKDVNLVVPLDILKGDSEFYEYMIRSNESHCAVQIKALAKIHAFVLDTTLSETKQADIRKECLKLWGIPDQARVTHCSTDPKFKFFELMKGSDIESFNYKPTSLNSKTIEKIHHVLDYRCIVGGAEQMFLLGLGKSQIYTWDGKPPLRWNKLENLKTELPRETLLSVEIVQELKGEMAEKFVKAVSKPSRPDMNPIRVKEVYRLEEMEKIFVRLEMKLTKSSGGFPRLSYMGRDDRHFLPTGLYIIKTVNDPWTMAYSKNSKRKFFYNKLSKESTYDLPTNAVAPFHVCHLERLFWAWVEGVRVHDSQTRVDADKLSKKDVLAFIRAHHHA
ncbi:UNVERIFIED_CONTAM: hypothetical protein FKN15_058407 [Acipenser sinensis]